MRTMIALAAALLSTSGFAQTAQPVTPPSSQGMAPNGAATTPPPAGSPMNPAVVITQSAGTPIQVRMQPDALAMLDTWAAKQADEPTRPEAIRRLVELG